MKKSSITNKMTSLFLVFSLILSQLVSVVPVYAEVTSVPVVSGLELDFDSLQKTLVIEGTNFKPSGQVSLDLSLLKFSDMDANPVIENVPLSSDSTWEINTEGTLITIFLGEADLQSIKQVQGDAVNLSGELGWFKVDGTAVAASSFSDKAVTVNNQAPYGHLVSFAGYKTNGVLSFVCEADESETSGFSIGDFIDPEKITLIKGIDTYRLQAGDAVSSTVQRESQGVEIINVTLTDQGKNNISQILGVLDDGVGTGEIRFSLDEGWYKDWTGQGTTSTMINQTLWVLPAVTINNNDVDKVYYMRQSGSDTLSFALSGLPEGMDDVKVSFGYLNNDLEFTPTQAVNGSELLGVETTPGTYTFTSPISADNNNDMQPLAVKLFQGDTQIEEPFTLIDDQNNSVYLNLQAPTELSQMGVETTDLSTVGLNLKAVSGFTFSVPEYSKIVFNEPIDILSNMEAFKQIQLGVNLDMATKGRVGFTSALAFLNGVDATLTMEDMSLAANPMIRVLDSDENLTAADGVAADLVRNLQYNATTKEVTFDVSKTGIYEVNSCVAQNVSFEDTDLTRGEIGGTLSWQAAADENDISQYFVYFVDAEGQLIEEYIDEVVKGGNYSRDLQSDILVPQDARYIGIVSDVNGDLRNYTQIAIVDKVGLSTGNTAITIQATDVNEQIIEVPANVTNATLDVATLKIPVGDNVDVTLPGALLVNSTIAGGNTELKLPAGTVITAPTSWTGIINLPQVLLDSSVTVSGGQVESVVEIGFGDIPLTFNKAARLVFPGQANKKVGWTRNGVFKEITQQNTANSQQWADDNLDVSIEGKGDAYSIDGNDLIVWTKHFTKFVTYTVNMPSGDDDDDSTSTITTPVPPVSKTVFEDTAKHWAKADIEIMVAKGVIKGITDKNFGPDNKVTRAQLATFVVRALGLQPKSGQNKFSDVKAGAWYKDDIQAAVDAGILTGYSNGTFKPEAYVSREETAVILVRALKAAKIDVSVTDNDINQHISQFGDGQQVSAWAKKDVAIAAKYELIKNNSVGSIDAKSTNTRAEAAVMLKRLMLKANLL